MGKLNFSTDEATLLKAYKLSSLEPKKWEDVDHDLEDSLAGLVSKSGESEAMDPLGLGYTINYKDMDMKSRASVLISSKTFDPKAFLATVHPDATYQDLAAGISHLKSSVDARSEAIRVLVEENFDKFVAVKGSCEALYADARENLLSNTAEYGSKQIKDELKLAATKADQVFLPTLENASKAQKLRTTLGLFERSKFFFNLPGSLIEAVEAGRYDAAIRDYKKGKFLLESRPGQLLPISYGKDSTPSAAAQQQQKRILDKVWASVERAMGEMRTLLLGHLQDPKRGMDEHEKTMEYLLELGAADDPMWTYFDSQHQHIMDKMKRAHEVGIANVIRAKESQRSAVTGPDALSDALTTQLGKCIAAVKTNQSEHVIAESGGKEVWQAIVAMVKSLSEVMLGSLPTFWKLAKSFMDGRLKKSTSSTNRRSTSQCLTLALDIVKLYVSLLSEFFILSDKAVANTGEALVTPPHFPRDSNSLTTSHYLLRLLTDVQEVVQEVRNIDISNDAKTILKTLMESTRWKFEDVLITAWLRDAHIFYRLETWDANPAHPATTLYLTHIQYMQRQLTTAAFKIAGGDPAAPGGKSLAVAQEFTAKAVKAFVDSMYAYLDGMVHLASEEHRTFSKQTSILRGPAMRSTNTAVQVLDLDDANTRLLLVISNFAHLSTSLIPSMMDELETTFGITTLTDRDTLTLVVQELDKSLFDSYIKPRSELVTGLVRGGLLSDTMDWYETPQPTEIRPYMFETLIYLVEVHAQVSVAAPLLLERTLNALVVDVADEAHTCVKQVKRFGMGGMLRATLEIEFLHQTLDRYVSTAVARTLADLYNKISKAYIRRPGDENFQGALDGVKRILADTRRSTWIEFFCFRQTKRAREPAPADAANQPPARRGAEGADRTERSTRKGRVTQG